jgi:putative tricarboxylic transport membrane protein
MLSLGIPGDTATAIILGGLLIHGLQPGPLLFQTHLDVIYALYVTVMISWIIILVVQIAGIRLFVRVLKVPAHLLSVCILVLCAIGAFAARNTIFDVYVMAGFGLLGYLLQQVRIPVAPIVLGIVLGPTLEQQYRTALILSEGNHRIFLDSPFALSMFALTVLFAGWQIVSSFRARRGASSSEVIS